MGGIVAGVPPYWTPAGKKPRFRRARPQFALLPVVASTLLACIVCSPAWADVDEAAAKVGIIECTPELLQLHNPDLAGEPDRLVCFEAYVSNFDTDDDDDGDGEPDILGVPHWVIQHVARAAQAPESRKRPRAWFTIPDLKERGIAPTDASYRFSARFRARHPDWFERGHLAQKYLAERLGESAGWFTHSVANAVPQRSRFNKGPWLALECYTGAWANEYGEIWIVSGPIFTRGHPTDWLRSDAGAHALPVAIPDSLFKIVARRGANSSWDALAFIYPQDDPSYGEGPWDPLRWATSISRIELLSKQQFLPGLGRNDVSIKDRVANSLWPVEEGNFDPGCRRFAKEIP